MADWTTIADSQVDPDAPLTSGLGYAWRDNPIAIAEGAVGAPKIARNIYGASGTTITFTGLGDFSGAIADIGLLTASVGATVLSVSFSNDGTTFYGSTTIYNASEVTQTRQWKFWVHFATGAYGLARTNSVISGGYTSGTIAGTSNSIVAIRFTVTGSSATTTVTLEPNGGIL